MTETEQIIVYDTMVRIKEHAPKLIEILTEHGSSIDASNYKSAIYSSVVRLSTLFTPDELKAHEERHRKSKEECDRYFAERKWKKPTP